MDKFRVGLLFQLSSCTHFFGNKVHETPIVLEFEVLQLNCVV